MIDTDSHEFVICPFCGHKHSDAWEMFYGDSGETRTDCEKCEQEFIAIADYSVDYQTIKPCTSKFGKVVCALGEGHSYYRPHNDQRGNRWNDQGQVVDNFGGVIEP